MVRTRIAPSPTGYPHIGTIYQALFDYVFARKYNGEFILRIEDTDRARLVEGAEDSLLDALAWFGLNPDEDPQHPRSDIRFYRQSERKEAGIYEEYINKLINRPLPEDLLSKEQLDSNNSSQYCAYYCFCSKERLTQLRLEQQSRKEISKYDKHCLNISRGEAFERSKHEEYVVRLNIPTNTPIKFSDWLVGNIEVRSEDIDDQVLLKADGYPTYHFAVVVDDYLMHITHIFRGREWLPSTPKHIILYYYFGWERPTYIHLPVILNADGKGKLSKRHGHSSVEYYRREGYLPDAILNYLINIVWNHPGGQEIFSLDEFKEKLHINSIKDAVRVYANENSKLKEIISIDENQERFITSQGPRFDLDKLTWVNQQYIQRMTDNELKKNIIEFDEEAKKLPNNILDQLIPLVKTRMKTLKDFKELTLFLFEPIKDINFNENEKNIATDLYKNLDLIAHWDQELILVELKSSMSKNSVKMPLFYKLFTGKERGLPLPQILEILGKERSLELLQKAQAI
jgi:glutamyl-tRNA synthetase